MPPNHTTVYTGEDTAVIAATQLVPLQEGLDLQCSLPLGLTSPGFIPWADV